MMFFQGAHEKKTAVRFVSVVRTCYVILSVLSSLTVLTAFILFAIGALGLVKESDDDLIMESIKRQIPEGLSVVSISTHDLHGFGNDSIIVLADDHKDAKVSLEGEIANQLLIFDKVGNEILNKIYHLFGYGSGYKLSYMFSLKPDNRQDGFISLGYALNILDVVELTGDSAKELIVKFEEFPSGTSGYYQIGIFSYSFEQHRYYLLGTYPPAGLYELGNKLVYTKTVFQDLDDQCSYHNVYDESQHFRLEYGCADDNDIFVRADTETIFLARAQMDWESGISHVSPHRYIITLFRPVFDEDTHELIWRVIFSEETTEETAICTGTFIMEFLIKESHIPIVDRAGETVPYERFRYWG